jgi:hypothetical protein
MKIIKVAKKRSQEIRVEQCAEAFDSYRIALEVIQWLKDNHMLRMDVDPEHEAYYFAIHYASDSVKRAFAELGK